MESAGAERPAFSLPVGTVTFLLTDIAGSTRAWEADRESMAAMVARYYEILDDSISRHGGVRPVEQGEGDSVVGAFSRASDAVGAALDAQRRFAEETELRVRIALHTGEAELRDEGNYFGTAVIRCARLRAVAHGGQVLVSGSTADLVAERLPDGASLVDLGVHRLKDLGRPERVWALRHRDLTLDLEAPAGLDTMPNNLPVQLTTFVGRTAELDELRALLPTTRLLTLTGVGGCGKTRLAMQVAAELIDGDPGGVWAVELAPVSEPDRIRATIALAFGELDLSGDLTEVLVARIGRQPLLLVWDNCEHLLGATAELADLLLRRCPQLTILATSREPLGVPGETGWRVPSLTLPTETARMPIETLSQYDAVRLFLDRARRARPNFRLTDETAPIVADICVRLDGIPLAIELAAARVRGMTVEHVAAGLADRFRLLTGGARTVLPRQQTLQASVDWGYGLLTESEQAAFRRLSVFASAFDLDTAEQVVAGGAIPAVDVLDLVLALVDKSMLHADDDTGTYRMLETMRQYGAARLIEAGEAAAVRDRHLRWVLSLHDPFANLFVDSSAPEEVGRARDDYRVAFEWAVVCGKADAARQVGSALALWEFRRGDAAAAAELCQRALDLDGGDTRIELLTTVVLVLARFEGGDWRAMGELLSDLLEAADTVADPLLRGLVLTAAGYVSFGSSRSADLRGRAAEAFELAGRRDLFHLAIAYQAIDVMTRVGDWRRAEERARMVPDDASDLALGNRDNVLFNTALLTGRFDEARHHLTARSDRYDRYKTARILAFEAAGGVMVDLAQGRDEGWHAKVVEHIDGARLRHALGALRQAGYAPGAWLLARGHVDEAAQLLVEWTRDTPIPTQLHKGIWITASALLARGDDVALTTLLDSVSFVAGQPNVGGAYTAYFRGALARRDGDLAGAERALHQMLAITYEQGLRPMLCEALEALAGLAAAQSSPVEAARLAGAAAAVRDSMGYVLRWPYEHQLLEADLNNARHQLGEAEFRAAYDEGRRLDDAAGFAYATRARGERSRPVAGWDSLTPTEAEVAGLASRGLTNRQIGEQLLMGAETVKTHLSRVYDKLAVRGRTELAAAYGARGKGEAAADGSGGDG